MRFRNPAKIIDPNVDHRSSDWLRTRHEGREGGAAQSAGRVERGRREKKSTERGEEERKKDCRR